MFCHISCILCMPPAMEEDRMGTLLKAGAPLSAVTWLDCSSGFSRAATANAPVQRRPLHPIICSTNTGSVTRKPGPRM
jgi:hypothetical protein